MYDSRKWLRLPIIALALFAGAVSAQGLIINGEATATITWTPPTEYEPAPGQTNGAPLAQSDILGYVLYWDTVSGVGRCSTYPAMILDPCYANALDLADGTISSSVITLQLNADTTMFFASAVYVAGPLLSRYSNEAVKQFTLVVNMPPNAPVIETVDLTITCTTNDPNISCTFNVQ